MKTHVVLVTPCRGNLEVFALGLKKNAWICLQVMNKGEEEPGHSKWCWVCAWGRSDCRQYKGMISLETEG